MAITNGYASLNEVKAALRITDNVDDTLIELATESASRSIDGFCSRSFWNQGTAVRVFSAYDDYILPIDDLATTNGLIVKSSMNSNPISYDTTWASTDIQLEPINGVLDGIAWPYTKIRAVGNYLFPYWPYPNGSGQALIQITGVWGWSAVPNAIKQATIIQSSRYFKRFDSPLGVAGFGDFGPVRVSRLDPDVEQLVMPYRKLRNLF